MGVNLFSLAKQDTTGGGVRGRFVLKTQILPYLYLEYFPFAQSVIFFDEI